MAVHDDVVVLGAGHNGLVCACYLARAGLRVRVLERRSVVGGSCVTEEFHPGFRNSTASYTVGLFDSGIIRDLKLQQHGLKLVPRPVANFLPLPDGESLTIYNELEGTVQEFQRFSKADARAFSEFREMVNQVGDVVIPLMHRAPPRDRQGFRGWLDTLRTTWEVTRVSAQRQRDISTLFLSSIADMVGSWFEHPHIQAAIAFDAIVGNYASLHAPGSAYGLLHHTFGELANRRGTWGHPIGGMGAITQALLKQALDLGVSVETEAEVVEVRVERGRARAAVLVDGTTRSAEAMVSNLAPQQLYLDLIDGAHLDREFVRSVGSLKSESAVLRMNVALSELPRFRCKSNDSGREHLQSGIIIGPTMSYMESAFLDAQTSEWSQNPVIEMLIPSIVDDSLAPPGFHVASLFCQYFPYDRDWDDRREQAADTVFQTLDTYAPNFSGAVIARQILTPLDLEREFGLPRGDIFHIAHTPSQLWVNRPVHGHAGYCGPIQRLYHCGAGSHPGGGVSGIPGKNAARQILREF